MLSRVLYYCILLPISWLPMWVLLRVSDIFSAFLFYIFPYRKKVIQNNLRNSFPEKSERELRKISRKFYTHFCDLLVETVKGFSMSYAEASKRMVSKDQHVLDKYAESGRHCLVVCGHFGNWELLVLASESVMKGTLLGIYKKLNDPFFERKMKEIRGRYGTALMNTEEFKNKFQEYIHHDERYVLALIMDQAPFKKRRAYWTTFLNQDTPVLFGPERYAKEYDLPVVYGKIAKVKRGYYEVMYEDLVPEPLKTEYGEITEKMTRRLEKDIIDQPEYWLWSHKRWKHKKPPESELEQYS